MMIDISIILYITSTGDDCSYHMYKNFVKNITHHMVGNLGIEII